MLPHAGIGRRAVFRALDADPLLPLHELVYQLQDREPCDHTRQAPEDLPNSEDPTSGFVDIEALLQPRTIELWDVQVVIDGIKPVLKVAKNGKALKSIPAGLRKTEDSMTVIARSLSRAACAGCSSVSYSPPRPCPIGSRSLWSGVSCGHSSRCSGSSTRRPRPSSQRRGRHLLFSTKIARIFGQFRQDGHD